MRGMLTQIFRGKVPVHQVPEAFEVLGTGVAVIDVVGVLPDVTGQQCDVGRSERCSGVAGVDDVERTVGLFNQPCPARTKVACSRLVESLFECSNTAPLGIDGLSQLAGGLAAAI